MGEVRKRVSGYNVRMEFFLTYTDIERLQPAETRLVDLLADPYPDGNRLRIALSLTPFLQKPYLELTLTNSAGEVVASTSIVEPVDWGLEFTLHILKPGATAGGVYMLTAILSFPDLGEIDRRELSVEITSPTV